jgi:hypothetical protein
MTLFRKLFTIIIILFLSSCSFPANWWKPDGYVLFRQMPKGGSPGYNLGWIHGCQSGLGSQFATAIYHTFYTWSRDPDITSVNPDIAKIKARYKKELKGVNWDNPAEVRKNFSDYNTIFWGAHAFCRHSALGILQAAAMTPKLPGEDRHTWDEHSLGNVYKINGKGDTRYGAGGLW